MCSASFYKLTNSTSCRVWLGNPWKSEKHYKIFNSQCLYWSLFSKHSAIKNIVLLYQHLIEHVIFNWITLKAHVCNEWEIKQQWNRPNEEMLKFIHMEHKKYLTPSKVVTVAESYCPSPHSLSHRVHARGTFL